MMGIIDEAAKRGMVGGHGEYNTTVHFKDQDVAVTLKNDLSRKGNTYFRVGKIYYISSFEGNECSIPQLLDAVEIIGLVIEKFNKNASKEIEKIAEAKAKLEAMKI